MMRPDKRDGRAAAPQPKAESVARNPQAVVAVQRSRYKSPRNEPNPEDRAPGGKSDSSSTGASSAATPSKRDTDAAYAKCDGVTHINIYSLGATELGRKLSHFDYSHFVHPYYGPFNCMEGFYYWVRSVERDDVLRRLIGGKAKEFGKAQRMRREVPNLHELIMEANFHKIDQNRSLRELFVDSTLPFDHYYLFGKDKLLIRPPSMGWLVRGFEELRALMKQGKSPPTPQYI